MYARLKEVKRSKNRECVSRDKADIFDGKWFNEPHLPAIWLWAS